MTCKDCLHYELCKYNTDQEAHYFGKDKEIYMTIDNNSPCKYFTDRSEWVHLPCKVGDSIFCNGELFSNCYVGEVMEFTADIVRNQVCTTHCGKIDMIFNFKDFGKTVFLTREEAEKALKGGATNE